MKFTSLFLIAASAWTRLPDVPDSRGFAGSFAGVQDGKLILAGGTHFTDKMPWEGGAKVWYDTVFSFDGQWKVSGRLPRPNGYGMSLTTKDGLIIAGGGNATEHYREVFWLQKNEKLPPLPRPCAFMSGCLLEEVIYLCGGIEAPTSTAAMNSFWCLDLNKAHEGWLELPPCPGGGRILGCMAAAAGRVWLFSGAALRPGAGGKPERIWLNDAWSFSQREGWQKQPDMPRVAVAAPGPAPLVDDKLLIIGGDDGALVNFEPKSAHPGFPRQVLAFDVHHRVWSKAGEVPFSLVTTNVVRWQELIVIPGGEKRPGVRSPEVWAAPWR